MTSQQKITIANELKVLSKKDSQNKLARQAGVSSATISQMINNKWDLIADEMWRKVQVSLRIDPNWNTAEIANYKMLNALMYNAQNQSISVAISHNAGAGKSHSYQAYKRRMEGVIYLECKTFWTRKNYMKSLCNACGLDDGGRIDDLVDRFVTYLQGLNKPFVIIDQLDKLNDSSLDLFMDFYNELDGYCGFLVSGVPALKKRILRGCQRDKSGYKEFHSRVGKTFIQLDEIKIKDVRMICEANGVTEEEFVQHTYNICDGDLRRVRREIDKYFLRLKKAA